MTSIIVPGTSRSTTFCGDANANNVTIKFVYVFCINSLTQAFACWFFKSIVASTI